MFWKKKYIIAVYNLYIEGLPIEIICHHYKLTHTEVDEIIDYVNTIIL